MENLFEISASGMEFQRLRLETMASNIANASTTKTQSGRTFRPMEAVARTTDFSALLSEGAGAALKGVEFMQLVEKDTPPRLVFEPGHPDANVDGFVAYPNVNPVDEMTNLITATRSYEANVQAFNAAKAMAQRALEIGE